MRGANADIHGYIQDFAVDNAAQLGLLMLKLVMQAAQGIAAGAGVIVLYENFVDAAFGELGLVVALEKKAAGILVHLRTNENHAWNSRLDDLQSAGRGGLHTVTVFNDWSRLV